MSALPLEPHTEAEEATVKRIEGAEPAEESFANVERVMQAIWEAADGYMSGVPWERAKANPFREAKVFRQAIAAIEAMKGPSPAEEALARVEALAEELANPGLHAGLNNVAARLRAAIAAPVAGQHPTDDTREKD